MKADLTAQMNIENLFNKNKLMPRIRKEFNDPNVINHCEKHNIPIKFSIDLLSQMIVHKRASVSILVGILFHHFKEEENPFQYCADMLLKAAEVNLVDWDNLAKVFIIKHELSSDIYEELKRYQFPLPCLIKPKKITSNTEDGYYTSGKKSLLLKNNHHDNDIYLEHINRLNAIELSINISVVNLIKNSWKDLDKQKPGEDVDKFNKRVKAFNKYNEATHDVIRGMLMYDNSFYMTYKYDKRGRCYAQGYHINPQGNPWNKAVIEFAQGEIITNDRTTH